MKVREGIEHILEGRRIFFRPGATDGRCGIPTLSAYAMVEDMDALFEGAAFVFCSANRKSLKILIWEDDGYYLLSRRLTYGSFPWPRKGDDNAMARKSLDAIRYLLLTGTLV